MHAVLGVDAAWTEGEPSGVALVAERDAGWDCLAVAPSYESFVAVADSVTVDWRARPVAGPGKPAALLMAARRLLSGEDVTLVTVDMPLATTPITGRRAADNQITTAFCRMGCSTHTPTATRPGAVGVATRDGFAAESFSLATIETVPGTARRLLDVYPHPALLALLDAEYRIPYKVSKSRKYWTGATSATRIANLLREFARILGGLRRAIHGISLPLPRPEKVTRLSDLKRYEDALDALVCAWVGIRYLAGGIDAYGDETAAIWVPRRRRLTRHDAPEA